MAQAEVRVMFAPALSVTSIGETRPRWVVLPTEAVSLPPSEPTKRASVQVMVLVP